MNKNDTRKRLITAGDNAVSDDVLKRALSECESVKGNTIIMKTTTTTNKSPIKTIIAVAAVFALAIAGVLGYFALSGGASTILIDVNPSVELKVNSSEKVISANPVNADGADILEGMNLKNTDLTVAVNALVGAMLQKGYINELHNSLLISVEGDEALQTKLTQAVSGMLSNAAILSQTLVKNTEVEDLAKTHNISEGKAALVKKLADSNPSLNAAELATLSINELSLLANSAANQVEDVSVSGTPSDAGYIGKAAAKAAALAAAGFTEAEVTRLEAELDRENGRMIYEVEFNHGGREYDCEMDATTGEILRSHSEIDDDDDTPFDGWDDEWDDDEHDWDDDDDDDWDDDDDDDWDDDDDDDDDWHNTNPGGTGEGQGQGQGQTGITITVNAATDSAITSSGVALTEIYELDSKLTERDGAPFYEIKFKVRNTAEYGYYVNASTGDVIRFKLDSNDDNGNGIGNYDGRISITDARDSAFAAANRTAASSNEVKVKFILRNDVPVFEVEIKGSGDVKYYVHALTGSATRAD